MNRSTVEALADGGVAPVPDTDGQIHTHRYDWALVRRHGCIVAATPALVTTESMSDLLVDIGGLAAASDPMHRRPRRLGERTLVVGTPLSQRAGVLRAPEVALADVLPALEQAIEGFADATDCHAVTWKDLALDDPLRLALLEHGYAGFLGLPAARLDLSGLTDLGEYLDSVAAIASLGDLTRKTRQTIRSRVLMVQVHPQGGVQVAFASGDVITLSARTMVGRIDPPPRASGRSPTARA